MGKISNRFDSCKDFFRAFIVAAQATAPGVSKVKFDAIYIACAIAKCTPDFNVVSGCLTKDK